MENVGGEAMALVTMKKTKTIDARLAERLRLNGGDVDVGILPVQRDAMDGEVAALVLIGVQHHIARINQHNMLLLAGRKVQREVFVIFVKDFHVFISPANQSLFHRFL